MIVMCVWCVYLVVHVCVWCVSLQCVFVVFVFMHCVHHMCVHDQHNRNSTANSIPFDGGFYVTWHPGT